MVRIKKIYTKTGDNGTTEISRGERVPKSGLRIELLGHLDELNSFLGLARTRADKEKLNLAGTLASIQNIIFDIGTEIVLKNDTAVAVTDEDITALEKSIDQLTENQGELKSFVLPGGCETNSLLHVCRTVCRRAEVTAWRLNEAERLPQQVLIYLNRLSDYLFALARDASHQSNSPEYLWIPRKRTPA